MTKSGSIAMISSLLWLFLNPDQW